MSLLPTLNPCRKCPICGNWMLVTNPNTRNKKYCSEECKKQGNLTLKRWDYANRKLVAEIEEQS